MKSLSCVRLFVTPWTVAYQAPPSMGFSRQEYWSRLPFLSPGDLPNPGIEPRCPTFQADALTSEPPGKPHELYSPWNSPGKNTGMGSISLLQGIFPTQDRPRSPVSQADSLPTELSGKPCLQIMLEQIDINVEINDPQFSPKSIYKS